MAAVGGGGGGGKTFCTIGHIGHEERRNSLKNLFLRNRWSEFRIILIDCSLCDPFQKLFAKF